MNPPATPTSVQFLDYLPEHFRVDDPAAAAFQRRFLAVFEEMFEELRAEIAGATSGDLRLRCLAVEGTRLRVEPPPAWTGRYLKGTTVTLAGDAEPTQLAAEYPGADGDLGSLEVRDASFSRAAQEGFLRSPESPGIELTLHAGGLPDLFHPDLTPPPQFVRLLPSGTDEEAVAEEYLRYLASWVGVPLRADLIRREGEMDDQGNALGAPAYRRRLVAWNRRFLRTALRLGNRRGTLSGLEEMLRAWLRDDLVESSVRQGERLIPGVLVADQLRSEVDVDTIFQLGERATLGVDTLLGEGPAHHFVVDLGLDPTVRSLRQPAGIDIFLREARFILETEKPAHTRCQLRARGTSMQLAPERPAETPPGEIYAQLGETTTLWDGPAIFDSD